MSYLPGRVQRWWGQPGCTEGQWRSWWLTGSSGDRSTDPASCDASRNLAETGRIYDFFIEIKWNKIYIHCASLYKKWCPSVVLWRGCWTTHTHARAHTSTFQHRKNTAGSDLECTVGKHVDWVYGNGYNSQLFPESVRKVRTCSLKVSSNNNNSTVEANASMAPNQHLIFPSSDTLLYSLRAGDV